MRWVWMIGLVAAVLIALVLAAVIYDGTRDDRIAEGITVGGVDVGGLDVEPARERVRRELDGALDRPLVVSHGAQRFTLDPADVELRIDARASADAARDRGREGNPIGRALRDLGGGEVDADVTPRVGYDRAGVRDWVTRVVRRLTRPARDADIDFHDGKLRRTRARNGLEVHRDQLAQAVTDRLTAVRGSRRIGAPVEIARRPDRTIADLAKRYPTLIAVDRDARVLRLYKRLRLAKRYEIAVGKAGAESAAGRYEIVEKTVNPPWHAPNKAWAGELAGQTIPPGDPRNPLEARWLGYHDGQGIHGTKDIASLGTAASHGCIRMSVPGVKELFERVPKGTPLFMQ